MRLWLLSPAASIHHGWQNSSEWRQITADLTKKTNATYKKKTYQRRSAQPHHALSCSRFLYQGRDACYKINKAELDQFDQVQDLRVLMQDLSFEIDIMSKKLPPTVDKGNGIFSIGGYRFVKHGQRKRIFLCIPVIRHLGCLHTTASLEMVKRYWPIVSVARTGDSWRNHQSLS